MTNFLKGKLLTFGLYRLVMESRDTEERDGNYKQAKLYLPLKTGRQFHQQRNF